MYKRANRMLAIVVLGLINTQISGMEEKQRLEKGQEKRAAAPLQPLAPKRQRVIEPDPREPVMVAPEKQSDQVPSPAEIVISTQPLVNIQIAALAQMGERFEKFALEVRTRFAHSDARMASMATEIGKLKKTVDEPAHRLHRTILPPIRVLLEGLNGASAAHMQPSKANWQIDATLDEPDESVKSPICAATAPKAAEMFGPEVPQETSANARTCTFTQTKDFLAHKGPVNYIKQYLGTDILTGSTDCFKLLDEDGAILKEIACPDSVTYNTFSQKIIKGIAHPFWYVGLADNTLRILGSKEMLFSGHKGRITCVKYFYSRAGQLLTSSTDNTIKMWDPDTGVLIRTITGHKGSVNALEVFVKRKKKYIVSGSDDKTVQMWDEEGDSTRKLEFSCSVNCLATFDHYIVIALSDGTFCLWNDIDYSVSELYLTAGNESVHTLKYSSFDETHVLIVVGYASKIVLCLVELVKRGQATIMHTIDSEDDAIRSMDFYKKAPGNYVLMYGTQSGRIKKGEVVIK